MPLNLQKLWLAITNFANCVNDTQGPFKPFRVMLIGCKDAGAESAEIFMVQLRIGPCVHLP